MAKKASLADFQVNHPKLTAPPAERPRPKAAKPATNERAFVAKTFELAPEAAREFNILRAETGKKSYQLAGEALNLLFKKYDKPQVG